MTSEQSVKHEMKVGIPRTSFVIYYLLSSLLYLFLIDFTGYTWLGFWEVGQKKTGILNNPNSRIIWKCCVQASGRLVSLQPGEWTPAASRRQSQSGRHGGRATKPRLTRNGSPLSSLSDLPRPLPRADAIFSLNNDCVSAVQVIHQSTSFQICTGFLQNSSNIDTYEWK